MLFIIHLRQPSQDLKSGLSGYFLFYYGCKYIIFSKHHKSNFLILALLVLLVRATQLYFSGVRDFAPLGILSRLFYSHASTFGKYGKSCITLSPLAVPSYVSFQFPVGD
jgi:hypothetical protein